MLMFTFFMGMFSFLIYNYHFLMILLSFELCMYLCFLMFIWLMMSFNFFSLLMIFMVMMVCGGAYGLSLMVFISRSKGVDLAMLDLKN